MISVPFVNSNGSACYLLGMAAGVCIFFSFHDECGAQDSALADSLILHASFDATTTADKAKGDAQLYTAETLRREEVSAGIHTDAVELSDQSGRFGGCLVFKKKADPVVFYKGEDNVSWDESNFSGTYSFWLKLSPETDLPPGYVDPLQITDKKWNDASFFVDFTDKNPRDFRLGVFSDYAYWNPDDRKWDEVEEADRPLVTVKELPFSNDSWTHVAITFSNLNADADDARATLYLDGKQQGHITGKQRISWKPENVVIMLGINYVGGFDDLGIFDRALSAEEIVEVYELEDGLRSLVN